MAAGTNYTPMIQQYQAIKAEHPQEILFFRLGDFYEMFFDDAILASRELEITLTGREAGLPERIPMCGVPYHAAENYIAKLINKGYKVAICEQTGDVRAKGLVRREVIKIITPGTVLSETVLNDANNQYIALLYETEEISTLVAADVSTGECSYSQFAKTAQRQALLDHLYRLMPPEIIVLGALAWEDELTEFAKLRLSKVCFTHLPVNGDTAFLARHFDAAQLPASPAARTAVERLLAYLHDTVKNDLSHVNRLVHRQIGEYLILDTVALRNLEITRNLRDGSKRDTLFAVLDFTRTAMGGRLLKNWLEYPLLGIGAITARQDAVAELLAGFAIRDELADSLKSVYDFERLLTRIEVGTANARDLIMLKVSLGMLPRVKRLIGAVKAPQLQAIRDGILLYDELVALLEKSIVDEPSFSLRDGGIIKDGCDAELDELRSLAHDSRSMLQAMEQRERAATGIKSLKIGYNKVFGYYIEVTRSNADAVPDYYIRKQTLANAERYITPELKEFETKILGAQERIVALEYQLFCRVRDAVKLELTKIQQTARQVARLDALLSLSEAANRYNYVRPQMTAQAGITIKDGRHPLVENILDKELFVPNDTALNHQDSEVIVITGPNMAGKSTYMRQVAMIVLMAQAGSFVPAREAVLSPVDRIFTRIGASDDLTSGRSTFMVEMNEVAQILNYATKNSLIVLDEIGRGTSTFDGMSIARAVIEFILDKIGAFTLFATHYHELVELENYDKRVKNCSVAVKERGSDVVFLRRIIAGGADKSYGIHVAKLAGLPKLVTDRAARNLAALEKNAIGLTPTVEEQPAQTAADDGAAGVQSLFGSSLRDDILTLDVMSMTPLEALNKLYQLQNQAKSEDGKV